MGATHAPSDLPTAQPLEAAAPPRPVGPVPVSAARPVPVPETKAVLPHGGATRHGAAGDDEEESPIGAFAFRNTSGMLISALVHMALLILLALLTITMSSDDVIRLLSAHVDGEEIEIELA